MSSKNTIFKSLDIIEKRINEKLTVESIAADIYISKFHYMRLFREIVGDSVMDYVVKRKLTLAAKALLETSAGILDIALDYGYDSREGFSRSFKALMGVTPAQYRKNSKTIISSKPGKENYMKYTQTTDTIIHELSEWIKLANSIAEHVRKTKMRETETFWKGVVEQTDILANNIQALLERVSSISYSPDEITNSIEIVNAIDDCAFVAHSIAFQIEMKEARETKQSTDSSFAVKYRELAWSGATKAERISEFFRELLLSVVDDMRKAVGEKINTIVEKGKSITAVVPENFNYIKDEIIALVDILSETPIDLITMQMLDDSFFKTKLITITAKLNIDTSNSLLFENLQSFSDELNHVTDFCKAIGTPKDDISAKQQIIKTMQDIVYMENVMFFYLFGEIENLKEVLVESEYQSIKAKVNDFKKSAFYAERDENDIAVFQDFAGTVNEIINDLNHMADKYGLRAGAIKVIADEQKRLTDKTFQCIEELETLREQ